MKNFKKDAKGITLLALVVTIIILIILATVSVNILVMDNGLIQKATGTGELAKDVTEDEHVKLAVADALITGAGKLSTENVRNALKSEFGEEKVTDETFKGDEAGPWEFKGDRDSYVIEKDGNIGRKDNRPLAKDVLTINPNAEDDYKKSPYVKYNGILWRVLYNDEYTDGSHGLQIISADNIKKKDIEANGADEEEKVTLGYEDDKVTASDFNYEGNISKDETKDEQFKHAGASYNKAVDTLNEKAKTYKDNSGIVTDARSLGSLATLKNGKFQGDITKTYVDLNKYSLPNSKEKFLDEDVNYVEDVGDSTEGTTGQLQKLGLYGSSDTWLASRIGSGKFTGLYSFGIRKLSAGGNTVSLDWLCGYTSGDRSCFVRSNGFRPVFLLSSDVKITGGDGTNDTPYELGI